MTYYSVYDEQIKELRTDYAYYQDKAKLKAEFEKHMMDIREVTPNEVETIWADLEYNIIETPLDFINEAEKQVLQEVVHGNYTNVNKGWFKDFNRMNKADIKSIIEFKEFGFASAWYVVFSYSHKPLVIKHQTNDVNTYHVMYQYKYGFKLNVHEMSYKAVY
ncbi:hypothetical protein [Staphylococcus shinii]|uniref:hypothetical protein n=1 Tax=Staphylococcus shinii TaxID=2912228 RepID=UPI003F551297